MSSVKKTKLVYLASPYSDQDAMIMEGRRIAACKVAADLIRPGWSVFCPIAHNVAIIQQTEIPTGWERWKAQDLGVLEACDELVVLMLPGWEQSKGVSEEIKAAEEFGIPVNYMFP